MSLARTDNGHLFQLLIKYHLRARLVNDMSSRIDDMEKSLSDLIEKINEQVDAKGTADD